MTVVLASKFNNGIAFAYDKLVCDPYGNKKRLTEKVGFIGRNLGVGVAGKFPIWDKEIFKKADKFKTKHEEAINSITREVCEGQYFLFGFMESSGPRLLYFNLWEGNSLKEKDWGVIGIGAYLAVKLYMQKNFDKNLNFYEAIELLNKGMEIAFEIARKLPDNPRLEGVGFAVVKNNSSGYYRRNLIHKIKNKFSSNSSSDVF